MAKKTMRAKRRPTTMITVNGERWRVPRGFGKVFLRFAKEDLRTIAAGKPGKVIADTIGVLELVGYTATTETVADWPLRKRIEASIYAANTYARAGDNPVPRFPRPAWLTVEPWMGAELGEGVWRCPGLTEIKNEAPS